MAPSVDGCLVSCASHWSLGKSACRSLRPSLLPSDEVSKGVILLERGTNLHTSIFDSDLSDEVSYKRAPENDYRR